MLGFTKCRKNAAKTADFNRRFGSPHDALKPSSFSRKAMKQGHLRYRGS
jgi:hypothetical protein